VFVVIVTQLVTHPLEAVGLGLIAETVTMLAKAARRERSGSGHLHR
jgi:hypothetical protein